MTRISRRLALALLFVVAACSDMTDPPSEVLDLTVSPQLATSPDTVLLRLDNRSKREVQYNFCTAILERRSVDGWSSAEPGRPCLGVIYGLRAGGGVSEPRALPAQLPSGTYRFSLDVAYSGNSVRLVSSNFNVE